MTALRTINCAEATERAAFFVLGALDTREALEVREHLETCSRAHEEFAEIGGVVPHLAELPDEVEPSAELRQRLLDAVDADVRARRREYDAAERLVASFGARPRAPRAEPTEPRPAPAGADESRAAQAEADEPRAIAVGPGRPPAAPEEISETIADRGIETGGVEVGAAQAAATTLASLAPEDAAQAPAPAGSFTAPRAAVPSLAPEPPAAAAATTALPAPTPAAAAAATASVPATSRADVAARPASIEMARHERARRPVMPWLVAAVALLGIVGLGAWNVLLQAQLAEGRDHMQALQATLAARNQPNAVVAVLAGTDAAPGVTGTAVMPPGRAGYLVVQGLPPAPAGKTYQAWYVTGKESRPAGLLKVGADGMAVLSGLNPPGPVDAMAVTLEQEGGVDRTSQQPVAYGKVSR
jgi:hypothetical protein